MFQQISDQDDNLDHGRIDIDFVPANQSGDRNQHADPVKGMSF